MADPRFFDNRGPFSLSEVCARANVSVPTDADGTAKIEDIASLTGAGAAHITFFTGGSANAAEFAETKAGYCLVPQQLGKHAPPANLVAISCGSVPHAFAATARYFYPDSSLVA